MIAETAHFNLVIAWFWILVGFVTGALLGLNFQREDWLGGYSTLKRRLYRLGHISFFGLAAINLMFYFTVKIAGLSGTAIEVASWAFVVGAVSMPACCLAMAHRPRLQYAFGLPVSSLVLGAMLTLWEVAK